LGFHFVTDADSSSEVISPNEIPTIIDKHYFGWNTRCRYDPLHKSLCRLPDPIPLTLMTEAACLYRVSRGECARLRENVP